MDPLIASAAASLILAFAFAARLVAPAIVRAIDAVSGLVRGARVSLTIERAPEEPPPAPEDQAS